MEMEGGREEGQIEDGLDRVRDDSNGDGMSGEEVYVDRAT